MSIDFPIERWAKIRTESRQWWAGELERPLIQLRVHGADPCRPEPKLPAINRATLYDLTIPPEAIVDRWDYDLSCVKFLGDAFPHVWPDMGPGVIAAFLGARAQPTPNTVWFHPLREHDIRDIHFEYDPSHVLANRIKDICREALNRWHGQVQVAMTDLGGNLDVLSSFRPGEKLLLDLYDHPDEVKRLAWEAHAAWWRAYEDINEVLQPVNPGYTAWTPIFSEAPYYILQCDFCYMIGTEMFDEFVKPELAASCRRLANSFYHLDGPGQLAHLDSLLDVKELKGVQWVPGDGNKPQCEWPDVYRRIRAAGKLMQVWDGTELRMLDTLTEQIGTAKGIILVTGVGRNNERDARRLLERYGVE